MRNGQDDFKRKSVSFDESVKDESVIDKSYHQKTINTSRTSEQKKRIPKEIILKHVGNMI